MCFAAHKFARIRRAGRDVRRAYGTGKCRGKNRDVRSFRLLPERRREESVGGCIITARYRSVIRVILCTQCPPHFYSLVTAIFSSVELQSGISFGSGKCSK